MTRVSYAVEGWTDEPVIEKLILLASCEPWKRFVAGGKSRLDPKLPGYNNSAKTQPWIVLRDLDDDAPCPAQLVGTLIGQPESKMALRIPVRSMEAWLLSDQEAFAQTFRVSQRAIPTDPDNEADPKLSVVQICASSKSSAIRAAMVPSPASGRKVGKEYGAQIWQFATTSWRIEVAALRSPSLRRSIERVRRLVEDGAW